MGGNTFTKASADGEPTLSTPRMTPKVYAELKATCIGRLQDKFPGHQISALLEAPEKKDYGDLDIIIAHDGHVSAMDIARHAGARGLIKHSTGKAQSFSLAVPQDMVRNSEGKDPVIYKHRHKHDSSITAENPPAPFTTELYAQIDVHIVGTAEYNWHIFYSSYGDLNILLGHIVRQHGFSLTEKGLFLRIPEFDAIKQIDADRQPSHLNIEDASGKLFLTNNPAEVMDFLGLSQGRYDATFKTVDDFFDWLSTSRFIVPTAVRVTRDNANIKKHSVKRPLFIKFLDDYLPKQSSVNALTTNAFNTTPSPEPPNSPDSECTGYVAAMAKALGVVLTPDKRAEATTILANLRQAPLSCDRPTQPSTHPNRASTHPNSECDGCIAAMANDLGVILTPDKAAQAKALLENRTGTLLSCDGEKSTSRLNPYANLQRHVLLKQALAHFKCQQSFDTQRAKLLHTIDSQEADHLLRPVLQKYAGTPDKPFSKDKHLSETLRAFQRWVGVDAGGAMKVLEKPHEGSESQLGRLLDEACIKLKDEEAVEFWVKEHWDEVKGLERQRAKSARPITED